VALKSFCFELALQKIFNGRFLEATFSGHAKKISSSSNTSYSILWGKFSLNSLLAFNYEQFG